jgi:DNA-binding FadR family transcriptional regulator
VSIISGESPDKADAAFHRRIASAARNPLLVTIFEAVLHVASDRSWRYGRETAHCINNQTRYAAVQRKIAVSAIARRRSPCKPCARISVCAAATYRACLSAT